jgi:hypothetical protein
MQSILRNFASVAKIALHAHFYRAGAGPHMVQRTGRASDALEVAEPSTSGHDAAALRLTREQSDVVQILTGIGPDVLHETFLDKYHEAMFALIIVREESQGRSRNTDLRKAANTPSLYLLTGLLKLHTRPFEPIDPSGPIQIISPLDLAKVTRSEIAKRLRSGRTKQLVEEVVRLSGKAIKPSEVQMALVADGDVLRSLESIKVAIRQAAEPLQDLGLIEIVWGTRGQKQKNVMKGLRLTNVGMEFMTALWRHSITASAHHHPAFPPPLENDEPGENDE